MKIIHLGKRPEDKIYRAGCVRCETVVEFQATEAVYRHDQRDGDFLQVPCPVCGSTINKAAK